MGHFKKAGVSGKRFVREFKLENADEYNLAAVSYTHLDVYKRQALRLRVV